MRTNAIGARNSSACGESDTRFSLSEQPGVYGDAAASVDRVAAGGGAQDGIRGDAGQRYDAG
jgi:hypothetical protein